MRTMPDTRHERSKVRRVCECSFGDIKRFYQYRIRLYASRTDQLASALLPASIRCARRSDADRGVCQSCNPEQIVCQSRSTENDVSARVCGNYAADLTNVERLNSFFKRLLHLTMRELTEVTADLK